MIPMCVVFFAAPHGMWDLSSLTRDQTHAPKVEAQSLNHWTTREVPIPLYKRGNRNQKN